MNKDFYNLLTKVRNNWCVDCDTNECGSCSVKDTLRYIEKLDVMYGDSSANVSGEGCHICKDKKGKNKDVFYDSGRGGFPIAKYCPECGRKM